MKEHAGKVLMKRKDQHQSLNSYSIRDGIGEVFCENGYICFASFLGLIQQTRKGINQLFLATTQAYNGGYLPKSRKKVFNKYLTYILNNSPFSHLYNTKRISDATRYGVSIDVNAPTNQVQCALIAVRRGWEFDGKLYVWNKLVENGVKPDLALVLSYYLLFAEGAYKLNQSGWQSNHELFGFKDFTTAIAWLENPKLLSLHVPLKETDNFNMKVFSSFGSPKGKAYNIKDLFVTTNVLQKGWGCVCIDFEKSIPKILAFQKEIFQ